MTDAAGNVAQTNITVSGGAAGLTIDPVSDPNELWDLAITETGIIPGTSDHMVWGNEV